VNNRRLFVYGAGGHGKVVADILISRGAGAFAGFVDDHEGLWGTRVLGYPVLGNGEWLHAESLQSSCAIALGIGESRARRLITEHFAQQGIAIVTLVHPSAIVSGSAQIGQGTVVMAGTVINPDAKVGAGAIVNTGAVVEHDTEIGNFSHVAPNATMAGASRLGNSSHLGMGAVVLPGIRIGSHTIVGAGAVVVENLPDRVVATGVPARIRRQVDLLDLSFVTSTYGD
jgi:sugar O-acyltransferase (sialic acid O-acetyltransferase NeuD family)